MLYFREKQQSYFWDNVILNYSLKFIISLSKFDLILLSWMFSGNISIFFIDYILVNSSMFWLHIYIYL